MKNFLYAMYIVMGMLAFAACSDDSVNNFSPVPYPDEMKQEEEEPDTDPDTPDGPGDTTPEVDPVWTVASTTNVFTSKASTEVSYRVPAVAVTNAGTLLVFCEARYKTWQDKAGRADILMKRSTDKGATWTETNITNQTSGNKSYMDPTVLVDRTTGKVFLFTSLWNGNNGYNAEPYMFTSEDDGATWSAAVSLSNVAIDIFGGFTRKIGSFGPGSGVQMTYGEYKDRLVVPMRSFKVDETAQATSNGGNTAMYSDDHGVTWKTGQPNKSGEWTVTEAPDGTLMGNLRYDGHRQNYFSTDGGAKWGNFSDYPESQLPTPAKGCAGSVVAKDGWLYYCGAKGITATNSYDDRGILYLAKAKFFDGHSHTFNAKDHQVLYEKAAGYTCMAFTPDGELVIVAELGDTPGFTRAGSRPAGWMRVDMFILSSK